jgi:hypothetical protein
LSVVGGLEPARIANPHAIPSHLIDRVVERWPLYVNHVLAQVARGVELDHEVRPLPNLKRPAGERDA